MPVLVRQETGALSMGVTVNGQFIPPIFEPLPDGLWGYTVEDVEELMRNNEWEDEDSSEDEYEHEEMDSDSESDSDLPPLAECVNNPPE